MCYEGEGDGLGGQGGATGAFRGLFLRGGGTVLRLWGNGLRWYGGTVTKPLGMKGCHFRGGGGVTFHGGNYH